jgi:hypothetical protein
MPDVRPPLAIATLALGVLGSLCLGACRKEGESRTQERVAGRDGAAPPSTPSSAATPAPPVVQGEPPEIPTRFAAGARVVAIGDLHGDLEATRKALRIAGAIGDTDAWSGGDLVLVQTGDQLDRGDDEPEILDLLDRLAQEAELAGGAVHVLNGNHEFMNAVGDLRYVTPEGFDDFADVPGLDLAAPRLRRLPERARARAAAFAPGGPGAKRLARRNTVVIVGDTVFVHGGVLPQHASKVDAINRDARRWLWGIESESAPVVATLMAEDSPVWTRAYGEPTPGDEACAALDDALRTMNAARMVVGHTVQKTGITSGCNAKVWRIDVGMAAHYGGTPQALEITDAGVRILR